MKTILTILAAIITFSTFGQSNIKLVKSRVDNNEILMNWKVNEVKEVNNVKINRLEGENGIDHRTNVFYIPKSKLLNEIDQKAQTEPLYNMEQQQLHNYYATEYPGGKVALFYDRESQSLADPRHFTVVVQDTETNEVIYEEKLDYQKPYAYKWGIWYYYKTVDIPKELGEEFTVKVIDEGLQQSFTFLVYENVSDEIPPALEMLVGK